MGVVMDFNEKKLESAGEVLDELKKSCADCRTTKTPLWRGGPAGPKSLCNACEIKYKKRRRGLLRLKKREDKDNKKERREASLKVRLVGLGRDMLLQMQRKRKLAKEEEAVVLLMALSCGFVFAA